MLTVVVGPMFAGKTTALVAAIRAAARPVLLRPARDTRGPFRTHDGQTVVVDEIVCDDVVPLDVPGADLIAVDEFHLFPEAPLLDAVEAWIAAGRRVLAAGLDMDYLGRTFPHAARLIARADDLRVLTGRCATTGCAAPATYTSALRPLAHNNVVGGADLYAPHCADCWRANRSRSG